MPKSWKKLLLLLLSALMVPGVLTACGGAGESEPSTEPEVTQSPEEAGTLKVLTIGHSLAVDCGHMLALIAAAEGYEHLKVGTLYYSGCKLYQHVDFLNTNSPEYDLYLSSTQEPNVPPKIMKKITMRDAIVFDYWDVIVMQGGVFEVAEDATYADGKIQTIQNYVNENKFNPTAIFAWHMPWATPTDKALRDMYTLKPHTYNNNYEKYGYDRAAFYNAITKCVGEHILTDNTFAFMIPSGTAIENALSSYLEESDLHRDYAHATDLGRVIGAYTWYCKLVGIDRLEQIKLDAIPKNFFRSTVGSEDRVLTDMEKAIILEAVNNALANPLQMTQSRYTQAPAR